MRLRRHTLPVPGAREVPDCVEISLREALDLLLWDPARGYLDAGRLPPDCAPALRSFYAARPDPAISGGAADSAEWFALCQHLPGCEYLKEAAAGGGGGGGEPLKYELRPSLRSLARAAGALLHPGAPRPWDSLADLARFWNGRGDGGGDSGRVTVDLRIDASRGAATEEVVRREYAVIRAWPPRAASAAGDATDAPPHSIEICLDPARYTATATHVLEGAGWLGQEARAAHSRLWLAGSSSSSSSSCADPVLAALQAPLLGDAMLEALQRGGGARGGAWEQAVLFARWGDGDAARWAPLQEGACAINASSAEMQRAARRQAGLLVRAVDTAAERGGAALLPWLLRCGASAVPLQPAAIAAALLRAPAEAQSSAVLWATLEGAADKAGSGSPALSPVPGGALVAALVRLQASASGGWRSLSACLAVELERAAKGDGPGWPRGSVRVLLEQAACELLRRRLPALR